MFIKSGKQVCFAQVATLDFIATMTVPRVLEVVSVDGIVHIVQEFIDVPVLEVI